MEKEEEIKFKFIKSLLFDYFSRHNKSFSNIYQNVFCPTRLPKGSPTLEQIICDYINSNTSTTQKLRLNFNSTMELSSDDDDIVPLPGVPAAESKSSSSESDIVPLPGVPAAESESSSSESDLERDTTRWKTPISANKRVVTASNGSKSAASSSSKVTPANSKQKTVLRTKIPPLIAPSSNSNSTVVAKKPLRSLPPKKLVTSSVSADIRAHYEESSSDDDDPEAESDSSFTESDKERDACWVVEEFDRQQRLKQKSIQGSTKSTPASTSFKKQASITEKTRDIADNSVNKPISKQALTKNAITAESSESDSEDDMKNTLRDKSAVVKKNISKNLSEPSEEESDDTDDDSEDDVKNKLSGKPAIVKKNISKNLSESSEEESEEESDDTDDDTKDDKKNTLRDRPAVVKKNISKNLSESSEEESEEESDDIDDDSLGDKPKNRLKSFTRDCDNDDENDINKNSQENKENRSTFDSIAVRCEINDPVLEKVKVGNENFGVFPPADIDKVLLNKTITCEICGSGDDEKTLLSCNLCNIGYHMACLRPPLSAISAGAWYCPPCIDSLSASVCNIKEIGVIAVNPLKRKIDADSLSSRTIKEMKYQNFDGSRGAFKKLNVEIVLTRIEDVLPPGKTNFDQHEMFVYSTLNTYLRFSATSAAMLGSCDERLNGLGDSSSVTDY